MLLLAVGLALDAGPALGQPKAPPPKPAVDAERPELPPLPSAYPPKLTSPTYCTDAEKTQAVSELEAAVAQAEQDGRDLDAWYDALAAQAAYDAAHGRRALHLEHTTDAHSARLEMNRNLRVARERLAQAKARGVTDCTQFKGVLPPAPKLAAASWSKRDRFCSQAELEAYRRELGGLIAVARRNEEAADAYEEQLASLAYQARFGPPGLRPWRKQIEDALKDYRAVAAEALTAQVDLESELNRAIGLKPMDCTGKTPTGGGSGAPPAASPPEPPYPVEQPPVPPTGGIVPQPKPGGSSEAPPTEETAPKPAPVEPKAEKPKQGAFAPKRPGLEGYVLATPPDGFCTEVDRNAFLTGRFEPQAAMASRNVQAANAYLEGLNRLYAERQAAKAAFDELTAIHDEIIAYQPVAAELQAASARVQGLYPMAMGRPIGGSACAARVAEAPPRVEHPPAPALAAAGAYLDLTPIEVGSNGKVGSGARAKEKLASTALGMLGGFLPGGGGGGGGSEGPQTLQCHMSDKEMTVFDDPATGVSLKIGARRSGDTVTVIAGVAKSPDAGTFQTAYAQTPDGARQAPKLLGMCDLWGEWSLSVSWTKSTYVNDQLVSRESGGWSKSGTFAIPGMVSSAQSPDGIWKRLGFSNASHGARTVALRYGLPKGSMGDRPLGMVLHITRPGQSPVTTAPFGLLVREGPRGFTFARALSFGDGMRAGFSEVDIAETGTDAIDYRTGEEDRLHRPRPKPAPPPPTPTPH